MRKKDNSIILECGDTLYRYDLEENLPNNWDSGYHNIEYSGSAYGFKNQIGAVFLFDKKSVAKITLAGAINKQAEKGLKYNKVTISIVQVQQEINLLNLSSGILYCSNLISVLHEIGITITTNDFVNFQRNESFLSIHANLLDLYSKDPQKKIESANIINEFFYNRINLLGQTLTDFQNGRKFKKLLENRQYEGYVFGENPISDTYCIFSSNKLSQPIHKTIETAADDELKEYLIKDLEDRKRMN